MKERFGDWEFGVSGEYYRSLNTYLYCFGGSLLTKISWAPNPSLIVKAPTFELWVLVARRLGCLRRTRKELLSRGKYFEVWLYHRCVITCMNNLICCSPVWSNGYTICTYGRIVIVAESVGLSASLSVYNMHALSASRCLYTQTMYELRE